MAGELTLLDDRYRQRIFPTIDGCWLWTGAVDAAGYGRFTRDGPMTNLAHRAIFIMVHGPIPGDLPLDHLCRQPSCVNPRHLEPVTHKENLRRSPIHNASKTHCPRGHEYDYVKTTTGHRGCTTCSNDLRRPRRRKGAL